jgi:hypothetical protein
MTMKEGLGLVCPSHKGRTARVPQSVYKNATSVVSFSSNEKKIQTQSLHYGNLNRFSSINTGSKCFPLQQLQSTWATAVASHREPATAAPTVHVIAAPYVIFLLMSHPHFIGREQLLIAMQHK